MGKIKIYEINIMSFSTEIKLGEKIKRIKFDGGIIAGNQRIPATYATDNEEEQKAIESLPRFKRKEIWLRDTGDASESQEVKVEPIDDGKTFNEVVNTQQAKALMQSLFKVEFTPEAGTQDVAAKGRELGLKFPKWISYNNK